MSERNVIDFLRTTAARVDLLDTLKVLRKDQVVAAAAGLGLPFSEEEFDSVVWDLEAYLADKRGEKFDQRFSLWDTMWGVYYLEYLVVDMITSLGQADFDAVLASRTAKS